MLLIYSNEKDTRISFYEKAYTKKENVDEIKSQNQERDSHSQEAC